MAEEKFDCEKCGREFDSERGLNIHSSQMHSEEDTKTEESSNGDSKAKKQSSEPKPQTLDISLGIKSTAVLFLMIGIFFGSTGTYLAANTGGLFDGPDAETAEQPTAPENGGETASAESVEDINLEDRPFRGDEDAPITMVKYEDFLCPFCGAFNSEDIAQELNANTAMPQIMEDYVEEGKVKVYYKHFPVVGGEQAALASECVAEQDHDAFWEFHDTHIDQFFQLSEVAETDPESYESELFDMAEQTDIDSEQFEQCYTNQEVMGTITSDAQEAESLGVSGTPGILIEDELLQGAQPFSTFQTVIEDKL